MPCHLHSFHRERFSFRKSTGSLGTKLKIPVNKLTFGEWRTTFNKKTKAFSPSLCRVKYTLHVINTRRWILTHSVPPCTDAFKPTTASEGKITSIHTQACGQREMFDLTRRAPRGSRFPDGIRVCHFVCGLMSLDVMSQ